MLLQIRGKAVSFGMYTINSFSGYRYVSLPGSRVGQTCLKPGLDVLETGETCHTKVVILITQVKEAKGLNHPTPSHPKGSRAIGDQIRRGNFREEQ